jgi:hypothetical protein
LAVFHLLQAKARDYRGSPEVIEKSRKWWDSGAKPVGLNTIGVYGCLGTESRDVFVFEAEVTTIFIHW